ncbi:hypothetical protein [Stenotrophomonas muris]|uniref:hypothetical protein n=1 Tax=Stenotrophomonas muris TaxID=2963283 RepID=UPI0039C6DB01
MGLDITWHRCLSKASGNEGFDEHGEIRWADGWVQFYVNPDFPGRADEIVDRAAYRSAESDGFRAGSYGGYNQWREQLAVLAGYPAAQYEKWGRSQDSHCVACWNGATGPFSELINFSDCEGVIGTSVSSKLARDFAEHQSKADAHPDERFRERYALWRRAFEKASDRGCVYFH